MRMAYTQSSKKLSYSQQFPTKYAQLIDKRKKAHQSSFIMKLVVALRVFIPIGTGIGAAIGAFVFPILGPIAGSMLGGAVASIFGVIVPVMSTFLQKVYRSFKKNRLVSSKRSQSDMLNQAREQSVLDHNILLKNLDNGTRTGDSLFSLGGRVTGQVYSHSNTPSAIIGQSIGSASGALIGLAPEIYELMQYKRAKAKGIAYNYERYHQRHKKISIFASRFRFAGLILTPIGLALGAVLGTFLFTGLGAAAVGFIFSAGFATIGGLIYSAIFLKKNTATLLSHTSTNSKLLQEKKMQQERYKRYARVGIILSLPSCSAIGAIIGTFVFPGLGTITGAAIGSVVGAILGSATGYFYSRYETLQSIKTNSFANKAEVISVPAALSKRTYGSLIKTGARMGSMVGAAVGGILGSVIPVVGTIAGTFIGAGIGSLVGVIAAYGASYFVQCNYKKHAIANVQQEKNGEYDQLIKRRLGHFGMGTWFGATLGAGIGAIIGTFVFPGLGTMIGAAIGSALGGVTSGVIGVIISKTVDHHHKKVIDEPRINETTSFIKANYMEHQVDNTVALKQGSEKILAQVQTLHTKDSEEHKSLSSSYANILTATEKAHKKAEAKFLGIENTQQRTINVINEQNDKDLHIAESNQFWKKDNASKIKQEKPHLDLLKQRSKIIQAPQSNSFAQIERSMSKAGI